MKATGNARSVEDAVSVRSKLASAYNSIEKGALEAAEEPVNCEQK